MKTKSKPKTLANCTEKELWRFRGAGGESGDFWLLCDSFTVSIHEQKMGEESKQAISIPRSRFNKLVAAYLKPRRFVRK